MTRLLTTVLAAMLVCGVPSLSLAQVRTSGQIVGTVKDATGAVVPAAALVLIDTSTGLTLEAKAAADGGFTFPNLQPGTYTLTATAGGFKPVKITYAWDEAGQSKSDTHVARSATDSYSIKCGSKAVVKSYTLELAE